MVKVNRKSTLEITEYTPKTLQSIHIYLKKAKNPQYVFYNHLFFALGIILIFCCLFLDRIYRLLKVKPDWLRNTTTEFERKKYRTRRENKNPCKLSCKARNMPPKGHTKNRPFVLCKISKDMIKHTLYLIVESSEQVGFYSNG